MGRVVLVTLAVGCAMIAVTVKPSKASAACSFNNGFYTCKYVDNAYLTASGPWQASGVYDYWYRNKIWRPISHPSGDWAAARFWNSTGEVGYRQSQADNPVVAQGPFGYSTGGCRNISTYDFYPVTCQIYNWNA
jgi:hypothetical protein